MRKPVFLLAALSAVCCLAETAPAPSAAAPQSPVPAAQKAPLPKARPARPHGPRRLGPDGQPRALDAQGRPVRRHNGVYGAPRRGVAGVVTQDFGKTADGRAAKLFRVMGQGGIVADFSDHGARLVRLYVPDRNGNLADVTVGHNDVTGYEKYDRNFNATVGRVANRIRAGKFTLDGQEYQLPLNWGPEDRRCCLHGGTNAMNFAIWQSRPVRRPRAIGVEFTHVSPDGDQGFPGTMTVKVTHWITADNVWEIDYEAKVAGKSCPLNLTNHTYFNLKGAGNGDACDHVLQICASKITPVDAGMIPTGEFLDVKGTPFDFLDPHVIGERLGSDHPQMVLGKGYDHNWVLKEQNSEELVKAAVLSEPTSGRQVEVWTTEPGLQFYGGNVMSGGKDLSKPVPGKLGGTLPWRGAIALETQHFPDSPNHANFPSAVLKPGETYTSKTQFKFGVVPANK